MELKKHREISEIIFGLVIKGDLEPHDVDQRMLTYPYNAALEDFPKAENLAELKMKYGSDAIDAANMAIDRQRSNGISTEDWLHELVRIYQDFKVVNVMHRITKQIENQDEVEYEALKSEIDTRLADIDREPVSWETIKEEFGHEWLWPQWIPHGEITILVGQQGAGKSAFALYLADCVANGKTLPDGSHIPEACGVLWVETEGRQAENIRRARLWGVNQRNIYSPSTDLRRVLDLEKPDDKALIRGLAVRPEVGLVVIDSLGGSLMNENEAMAKKVLQEMARMAQETATTFLIIHHLRKQNKMSRGHQAPTLNDVRGHSGITQFAPSVIAINYEGNELPRFLYPLKMNLVEPPTELSFTIGPLGLVWNDNATDHLQRTLVQETVIWLEDLLSAGPISVRDVLDYAERDGYDKELIKQALYYPSIRMVNVDNVRCLSL